MIYIYSDTHVPYFNIAAEEYLLKNFNEDIFYLYRNNPSIIVGKNQNTLSEINFEYVKNNNIPVVRRLSGGGAVFHDLGNLNFCFITTVKNNSETSFKEFTKPILDVLNNLGVNAEFSGRNDLTIEGKKFSGNAQYFYKDKILHHGTLLFSSNIIDLSSALKVKPSKFKGKGIKSVKSRVTNISTHLKQPLDIENFVSLILEYIMNIYGNKNTYKFSEKDINEINKLVEGKYNSWEWVYGNSPSYSFHNELKYSSGTVEYCFEVKEGLIKAIKIYGDFFNKKDIIDIENALVNVKHNKESIKNAIKYINLNDYFLGITEKEFISGLF